jgi:hypothetical protein
MSKLRELFFKNIGRMPTVSIALELDREKPAV